MKDTQSGSQRETVTNNEGYFTFASVPVGTYDLTVEAKGFSSSKVTGISLGGGEKRNVDMSLKVGTTSRNRGGDGHRRSCWRRWIPARNRPR